MKSFPTLGITSLENQPVNPATLAQGVIIIDISGV